MTELDEFFAKQKRIKEQGAWIPGCNQTEVEFKYKGTRLLYVYQPSTGKHGYLNLDQDFIYNEIECQTILD